MALKIRGEKKEAVIVNEFYLEQKGKEVFLACTAPHGDYWVVASITQKGLVLAKNIPQRMVDFPVDKSGSIVLTEKDYD